MRTRLLGLASIVAALSPSRRPRGRRASAASSRPERSRSRTRSSRASTSARAATSRAGRSPAAKCLECHKPVAERIKAKKGVHRDVAGKDCAGCHVEHAGLDGDLLHFEPKGFDHKGEAGFALDGLHAPLDCKACHKTRSYLGLSASCASCHKDVHNGTLGATCQTCHPTNVAFKDTRKGFDHAKTKYPLTGAHAKTPCESCHKTKGEYKVARFAACEDCHRNPHVAGARDVHGVPRHGELQDARRGAEVRPREDRLPAPRPSTRPSPARRAT